MARWKLVLILLMNLFVLSHFTSNIAYNIPDPDCTGIFNLCTDADKERLGRLAIKSIHEQMDDDKDGMIEASETSDFIEEELESKTDHDRHHRFQNENVQITLDDLWNQWKTSAVYNWTNEDVIDWLVNHVHLPMYVDNFRRNQIDGRLIPRIAVNEKHYLSSVMQIKDPRHKRRLVIKATDIILFGPPKSSQNLVKDVILISALVVSTGACLYAFVRHRKIQESMKSILKDREKLKKAEDDLNAVKTRMEVMEDDLKIKVNIDRGVLSAWYQEIQKATEDANFFQQRRIATHDTEKQLAHTIKETEFLRVALRRAEDCARYQSFQAPPDLKESLRKTHRFEKEALEVKRQAAMNGLNAAKEQMEKVNRMHRGFFGAVRIAHTDCMEKIADAINAAKEQVVKVQHDYEESEDRWIRIAYLTDIEDFFDNMSKSTDGSSIVPFMNPSNGVIHASQTETNVRLKQSSMDSSSVQSSNDSPRSSRQTGHGNDRLTLINSATLDDTFQMAPTNTTRRRRTVFEGSMFERRSSSERLELMAFVSNSTQNISGERNSGKSLSRPKTYACLDDSLTRKPVFDLNGDDRSDTNDIDMDEYSDNKKENLLNPSSSAKDSNSPTGSQENKRRTFRDSKFFKSFSKKNQTKKKS